MDSYSGHGASNTRRLYRSCSRSETSVDRNRVAISGEVDGNGLAQGLQLSDKGRGHGDTGQEVRRR